MNTQTTDYTECLMLIKDAEYQHKAEMYSPIHMLLVKTCMHRHTKSTQKVLPSPENTSFDGLETRIMLMSLQLQANLEK